MKKHLWTLLLVFALSMMMAVFASADGEPETHTHCECGGKAVGVGDHTTCADVEYTEWNAATAIATVKAGGNFYLSEDITISEQITVASNATLRVCLNGHTITQSTLAAVFQTNNSGAQIIICDCQEGGTMYTYSGDATVYGGGICHAKGKLYSGTLDASGISLVAESVRGGAVYVGLGETFKFYNGTIIGGKAVDGGSVALSGGAFYMYGGTIKNGIAIANSANKGWGRGGNIFAYEKSGTRATVQLLGGTIENGIAACGGNISCQDATLFGVTVQNGTTTGCKYLESGATTYTTDGGGMGSNLQIMGTSTVTLGKSGDHSKATVIQNGTCVLSGNGGGICATGAATLNIYDGVTIKNHANPKDYGNIYFYYNTSQTINIYGGFIGYDTTFTPSFDATRLNALFNESNTKTYTVKAENSILITTGTLNISGGEINANNKCRNIFAGANTYNADRHLKKFNMTGGVIRNGANYNGANVFINRSELQSTISGGTIEGGAAGTSNSGGNLYLTNNANLSITNGKIQNGSAKSGGNIMVSNSTLSISGSAQILNGTAYDSGGNMNLQPGAVFTMSDGTVTGGKINTNSNSVKANFFINSASSVSFQGSAKVDGRIELMQSNADVPQKTVSISGNPVICDETVTSIENYKGIYIDTGTNAFFGKNNAFTMQSVGANARVFLYFSAMTALANANDGFTVGYFEADHDYTSEDYPCILNSNYLLTYNSGTHRYSLSSYPAHSHCYCGGMGSQGNHTSCSTLTWTNWVSTNSIPVTGGNFVLQTDIILKTNYGITVDDLTINLCLNGHTIYVNSTRLYSAHNKPQGATSIVGHNVTLNICDCNTRPSKGTIVSGNVSDANGGGVFFFYAPNRTKPVHLSFFGIKLDASKRNITTADGGVANMGRSNDTVDIYNSEIISAKAANGGCIYTPGPVYVNNSIIRNGIVSNQGGNFYINGGSASLTLVNSTVEGGTATNHAGNIYVATIGSTLTITNSTIKGGVTSNQGGNIYASGATINFNGGLISDGISKGIGGNICLQQNVTFNMTDGVIRDGAASVSAIDNAASIASQKINESSSNIASNSSTKLNFSGGEIYGRIGIQMWTKISTSAVTQIEISGKVRLWDGKMNSSVCGIYFSNNFFYNGNNDAAGRAAAGTPGQINIHDLDENAKVFMGFGGAISSVTPYGTSTAITGLNGKSLKMDQNYYATRNIVTGNTITWTAAGSYATIGTANNLDSVKVNYFDPMSANFHRVYNSSDNTWKIEAHTYNAQGVCNCTRTKAEVVYTVTKAFSGVTRASETISDVQFNQIVRLYADQIDGYRFVRWTDGTNILSYNRDCVFAVKDPMTVTAIYESVTTPEIGGSETAAATLHSTPSKNSDGKAAIDFTVAYNSSEAVSRVGIKFASAADLAGVDLADEVAVEAALKAIAEEASQTHETTATAGDYTFVLPISKANNKVYAIGYVVVGSDFYYTEVLSDSRNELMESIDAVVELTDVFQTYSTKGAEAIAFVEHFSAFGKTMSEVGILYANNYTLGVNNLTTQLTVVNGTAGSGEVSFADLVAGAKKSKSASTAITNTGDYTLILPVGANQNAWIYAVPYVVIDGDTIYGDVVTVKYEGLN